MTIEELGRQIKTKHPEYGNFPDAIVANRVLIKYPEYKSKIDNPVNARNPFSMAKAAMDVLPDVAPMAQPQNVVRENTLEPLAESTAEFGGRHNYPGLGAAAGTLISKAPEILSTALGLRGIYKSQNPVVKGLVNTTQELGPEYGAQNEAIGVTRRVPPEGGMAPRYAPPERIAPTKQPIPIVKAEPTVNNIPVRYPSKPGDFLSYANGRLSSEKGVAPQELMDWQVKLQTDLSNGTIPKIDPTTGRITTVYQQATDLLNRTKSVFNKASEPLLEEANLPSDIMPTREGLNKAFKVSASQEALIRGLKKAGKYATLAALGLGGGGILLNRLSGSSR